MVKFFRHIISLIIGYFTIGSNLIKKPVTVFYPEKKKEHKNLRGKISFAEGECKCIACGICKSVCPSKGTIKITTKEDEGSKKVLDELSIDLSQCIQCGNCAENCPTKTLIMTNDYEYSSTDKIDLIIRLRR
ncbi:4Fe-4S dicluster domain-containing protein [bacterium]|nr:4Fe-4S dicluster domain-containing protein [bacterium]